MKDTCDSGNIKRKKGHENEDAGTLLMVPPDKLEPNPEQPRKHFHEESLMDLGASIREQGIIEPLIVRPHPRKPGTYQIVAGERRWRAARAIGLAGVPVVVRELGDRDAGVQALMENVHREDLNPFERAAALERLKEALEVSNEELATLLGFSKRYFYLIKSLAKLPEHIQLGLREAGLSEHHARALQVLKDHPTAQSYLCDRAVAHHLTGQQTYQVARTVKETLAGEPDSDQLITVDRVLVPVLRSQPDEAEKREYTRRTPYQRALHAGKTLEASLGELEAADVDEEEKAELRKLLESLLETLR